MFENCGEKIKILAKVLFWVGVVASIIVAINMFVEAGDAYSSSREEKYLNIGFAFLLIGPLVSWVSSLLMYGFGELIETNSSLYDVMARNTRNIKIMSDTVSNMTTNASKESVHTWRGDCDLCDKRDVPVRTIKIVDDFGVRFRNACDECARKYDRTIDRDKELDELLHSGLITKEEYEAKKGGK